ncbi:helix-turn-helix domain-containing protein [Lederbergia wuyishanensis]|uniref:Transcriptional regulator with XRE-family HTH domain n=1 Tax=Lederbergia wuyishanensis TaxID=1347903 RepID=A0ABU0D7C4_9BACI|nr:helix-turn-helix transcriptional regulator [Lederbergia wuyishanensis]MCJ8008936.1 helix-turn-helix domain-containing protein [Lederbergia wuyishanensis]MDQ0344263.1 transcriptional regulator with XRE-family HTH domain [Lederbergia wuyishanensis]
MNLGAVLKKARITAGLSQEEMALRMFIPRSTVSRLENDKTILKADDLIRWCHITQAQEMLVALLVGVDPTTIIQNISMLIGGFITWI